MNDGIALPVQDFTGVGDSIVALKDFSLSPKDNTDRLAKLGKGQARPFGMIMLFDRTSKLRDTPDGFRGSLTIPNPSGTGVKTVPDRAILKFAEPDNWLLRDHAPPDARGEPTNRDQTYAVREIIDRQNAEWKRANRSTLAYTQQKFPLQAGAQNVRWVKLVPTRAQKPEEKFDAIGECTWVTKADEFVRRVGFKTSGLFITTAAVVVGLNPDIAGNPTVPVFQPVTSFSGTPPAPGPAVVFTGGGTAAPSGPSVQTVAVPKDSGKIRADAVCWSSQIINVCGSGGYVGGFGQKLPAFASGDVALLKSVPIGPGVPPLLQAWLVKGNAQTPEPEVGYSPGATPHLGNLSHVLSPIYAPWLLKTVTGDSDPEDSVAWGGVGLRPDTYFTSPRADIFGPLSIDPMFWDRPQGLIGHHLLGDLYWSNDGTTLRGPRFAGDPNANTKEIDRPPTPWRLRLVARQADFPAWHLPPNLFKGNFCDAGDDPLPMGTRQGVIGMGVAETVDWPTRKVAPIIFSSPHGPAEYLGPGLRLSAHFCAKTSRVDEVAAHAMAGQVEIVERRIVATVNAAAVEPSELHLRRRTGDLLADRLQFLMLSVAQGLSGVPISEVVARDLAAKAADVLRDLAELQAGRDVPDAVRRFGLFVTAATSAASTKIDTGKFRRVPFLPPAGAKPFFPGIPANPSGLRFADVMQQAIAILNAHTAKLNRDRMKTLLKLTSATTRDTTNMVTAAPDGRVFHADENGDLEWDANLQFDRTNKRLGARTATPKSTIESAGSFGFSHRSVAADATLGETDVALYVDATGAGRVVNLPQASTVSRRVYMVKKTAGVAANRCRILPFAGDTIDGAGNLDLVLAGDSAWIQSLGGTDWQRIG